MSCRVVSCRVVSSLNSNGAPSQGGKRTTRRRISVRHTKHTNPRHALINARACRHFVANKESQSGGGGASLGWTSGPVPSASPLAFVRVPEPQQALKLGGTETRLW